MISFFFLGRCSTWCGPSPPPAGTTSLTRLRRAGRATSRSCTRTRPSRRASWGGRRISGRDVAERLPRSGWQMDLGSISADHSPAGGARPRGDVLRHVAVDQRQPERLQLLLEANPRSDASGHALPRHDLATLCGVASVARERDFCMESRGRVVSVLRGAGRRRALSRISRARLQGRRRTAAQVQTAGYSDVHTLHRIAAVHFLAIT